MRFCDDRVLLEAAEVVRKAAEADDEGCHIIHENALYSLCGMLGLL